MLCPPSTGWERDLSHIRLRRALLLVLFAAAMPAAAAPDSTPGGSFDPQTGAGESHWGHIPEPADSLTLVYEDRGAPAWATASARSLMNT